MKTTQAAGHPTDQALLLLDANELDRRAGQKLRAHLLACPSCRERMAQLSASDSDLRSTASLPASTTVDPVRDRLLASLVAATQRLPWWRRWLPSALRPAGLLRLAAVVCLCLLAATYRQRSRPLQDRMGAYEDTGPEPDHVLTPGSTRPLSVTEICRLADDDLDPKLSFEKQRAVFRAYRMNERAAKAYQVDYLINPQLGGDDSLTNLWPEPYHATVWNATAKDALETRLHGMVCGGEIDLHSAQRELADDWIAAYKKYFHTERPVRTVAAVSQRDPQ